MHEMYELRDKLCDELKEQGRTGVSAVTLTTIDTLAHAIKNIDKIIEDDSDEYSNRAYPDRRYSRGRMGRYSYDGMDDKESIRHEIRKLEERLNKM